MASEERGAGGVDVNREIDSLDPEGSIERWETDLMKLAKKSLSSSLLHSSCSLN